MTGPRRFPIRFTGLNRALAVLGIVPSRSDVTVDDGTVVVRFGWAFHATIDRRDVATVALDDSRVWGWGAHGWRGEWLVNGSSSGIVRVELDPPGRALVIGVRVRLRVLRVAVDDPDGLVAALTPARVERTGRGNVTGGLYRRGPCAPGT